MDILSMKQWSPYAVGIGIGLLNCLAFLLSDRYIGCSKAFSDGFGAIERIFKGSRVMEKPYYRKFVPQIDWFLMLVIGIVFGAFISAWLSASCRLSGSLRSGPLTSAPLLPAASLPRWPEDFASGLARAGPAAAPAAMASAARFSSR